MPLTATDCKLLPPGPRGQAAVDAYTGFEAAAADAQKEFTGVLRPEEFAAAAAGLREASELLRRDRYRIGFLGQSSFAKSSTLNRVARADLAPEGDRGAATTSIPTRFRPAPAGTPATATLEYLTSVRFQRRRAALADSIGLKCPPPEPDKPPAKLAEENTELLGHLATRIAARKAPADGSAPPPDSRGDDLDTLARLLRAYNAHGARLVRPGDVPLPVPLSLNGPARSLLEQVTAYVIHNPAAGHADAPENELLWQVVVTFPTSDLSPDIDLIDLPGVGVNRVADDLTTGSFLEEFDGALVFQLAGQVQIGKQLDMLYGKPDPRWPYTHLADPLVGRVWVIGTKADILSPGNLGYKTGVSFLEGWKKALDDQHVPLGHMLYVCNFVYDMVKAGTTPADVCAKLNLQRGPDGRPAYAAAMDREPVLKAAYEEVVRDGGIERLRRVVREDLRDIVGARVAELACLKLRAAAERLRRHAEQVLQAGTFNKEEFINVRTWLVAAKRLAGDRRADDDFDPRFRELDAQVTTEFTAVKQKLRALFAEVSKGGQVQSDLRKQHQSDAVALLQDARQQSREAVAAVRKWVKAQFEARGAAAGPIKLDEYASPAAALEAELDAAPSAPPAGSAAAAGGADADPYARLADGAFFPSDEEASKKRALQFPEYVKIMALQIDACVHETSRRCVGAIRAALGRVRGRLEALNDEEKRPRIAYDKAALQKLIARLEKLVTDARAAAAAFAAPTGGRP